VCNGCVYSCSISGNDKCPFCNANVHSEDEIIIEQTMKRVEANDVTSINYLGGFYAIGQHGLRQDWSKALELWTRAAELGSSMALYQIGGAYNEGWGVEKDMKKAIHHFELAAMAGHAIARYNLGYIEADSGNMERAMKHWTISASAGDSKSMTAIQTLFEEGNVRTDAYELTLKSYNHSCEEMRSKAREDAGYVDQNGMRRG
jgi:TPR repeat protein